MHRKIRIFCRIDVVVCWRCNSLAALRPSGTSLTSGKQQFAVYRLLSREVQVSRHMQHCEKRRIEVSGMDIMKSWIDRVVFSNENGNLVITNMCRVCGIANEGLIPIYEGQGLQSEIGPKLKQHLPVQVLENDSLPKEICFKCASTVVAWHNLTVGCLTVNKNFHDLLRSVKLKISGGEVSKIEDISKDELDFNKSIGLDKAPVEKEEMTPNETSNGSRSLLLPSSNTLNTSEINNCISVYQPQDVETGHEKIITSGNSDVEESNDKSTAKYYSISVNDSITSQYYVLEVQEDSSLVRTSDISQPSEVGQSNVNQVLEILDNEHISSKRAYQLELDHNYVLPIVNEPGPLEDLKSVHEPPIFQMKNSEQMRHCSSQKPYVLKFISSPENSLRAKVKWKLGINLSNLYHYCDDCDINFKNEGVLLTHMRFHSGLAPFYCKFCGKSFLLSSSLKQHLKICYNDEVKRDDEKYSCTICGNKYKLKASLKEHLRQHVGKGRPKFKCHICENKFLKKADIMEHMKSHEDIGLILCPYRPCDRRFLSEKDLQDHQISHFDDRPYVCESCGLTYKRKSHLRRHMLNHALNRRTRRAYNRRVPGEEFVCGVCRKVSHTRRLHKLHALVHTGERNYECPVCHKRFVQSGAVTRHIRTVHRGFRDFLCEICKKSFTAKASLENHIRIHTGEKPFQCTVCGKTFRTQQLHKLHEKIHSDERPFPCEYCSKTFRRRPHLVVHTRTHTGEKPFACPTCNRGFAQKNDMLKHTNVHFKNS